MTSLPVRQFQILAKNPERAAQFYERAFGWSIQSDNSLAYRAVETGGISGGIWPASPDGHGLVQLYLEVSDVAAIVENVVAAGGTVLIPPTTLPDGDELAIVLDPEQIPFGLFRRKT
ncbi:MAG: VOC family protein [Acidobacteriota bacterium]